MHNLVAEDLDLAYCRSMMMEKGCLKMNSIEAMKGSLRSHVMRFMEKRAHLKITNQLKKIHMEIDTKIVGK